MRAPRRCPRAGTPSAATPSRADTVVTDYHGRAVCFASGEPSGLAATMASALGQLREITGDKKIMLDRPRRGPPAGVPRCQGARRGLAHLAARPPAVPAAAATGRPAGDGKAAEALELAVSPWQSSTTAKPGRSPCSKRRPRHTDPHQRPDAPAAALLAWLRWPPGAKKAILRTRRRAVQMVLRPARPPTRKTGLRTGSNA